MRDFTQNSTSESYPVPLQYSCMWSEIIQSYWKLCERHNKSITQRKEICKLAHPKRIKSKNPKKCSNSPRTSYKIEIVNNTDKMKNTRTEQLAFPQLRCVHTYIILSVSDFQELVLQSKSSICPATRRVNVSRLYGSC